ncbi:MAG: WYL domain-containing protein [Hymenobacteraceae bacterium]|nr:WYL domain-containing protein [Hymenobacteraceae bacterium]
MEEISKAIGARLLIRFSYNHEEHVVEPHLVGQDMQKQDCLCAWRKSKIAADSAKECWRCYHLSEIKDLEVLEQRFSSKRPGYDPYDSTMSRIYYRV